MNFYDALKKLRPNSGWTLSTTRYEDIIWQDANTTKPSIQEINDTIIELEAAEPMRLLRLERNRLLQETDWEITRGLEEGLNIDSLKTYRTALRNLPQQIEAGEITAPTLDDNGMLVFEHWPERTDA